MSVPERMPANDLGRLFPGDSEMAQRMRALDWSTTDLGDPWRWPESLRTAVSICLTSRFPIVLWWGPNLTLLYNDAYSAVMGPGKHPQWLGKSGRECWSEIWETIGPMLDGVMRRGVATWSEELQLVLDRHLPREEGYFTFSYSPILTGDASRVGGIFCAVTEATEYVVNRRRLATLRALGHRTAKVDTAEAVCERAADVLRENAHDVPCAALYLVDQTKDEGRLVASARIKRGRDRFPATVDLTDESASPWSIATVWSERRIAEVPVDGAISGGPWPESATTALVLPVVAPGVESLGGVLVAGVSPRRPLDDAYRAFFQSIATQLGAAIAEAHAYEAERKRAESLAALDRAKTAFFSNVSHEFRTPLTLLMGPLEDALESAALPAAERDSLEVAHRNSLRLLKLVNTLLDFSRIEAGRAEATFERVDVAAYTAELASVFRSATERAGLSLAVECAPVRAPVFLDREMWEKVVLNLLSNAFKFTLEGGITVRVRERHGWVDCVVEDTGIGIAPDELPHVFERFHRVKGAQGRTHEGSGIGLALVSELVKLHGGRVGVESEPGRGSRFTVTIPTGSAHIAPERIGAPRKLASTALGAAPYIEEALRWLPESFVGAELPAEAHGLTAVSTAGARVLVADDNVDMRDYLARLLRQYWHVDAVADGEAALDAIRRTRPDLVLTDVMMPRLDGIGLLRAIRANPELRSVPVILLSARAGEESRVEGLETGADDYLVKPFSARELLARVNAHLEMARVRERARAEAEAANRAKDEFLATVSHELRSPLQGILGWLTLLRRGQLDAPKMARALEAVERSVRLQAQIVQDIMEISRIVAGKVELERVPLDLSELVLTTAEEFMPGAVGKGIDLAVDAESCGLVMGDSERLHQAVSNLVTNAIKFTRPGGRVTLACKRMGDELEITVTDTGEGIAPEFLPHLFDRFTQADTSSTRRYGGLGLGLFIVRHLVELHHGTVTAESAGKGRGATFRIRLAALPDESSSRLRADEVLPALHRLDGVEILLVEDDADALEAMTQALVQTGAMVRPAASAREAWDEFNERRPDLVVSDLSMPEQDGYWLLRRIRGLPSASDVPAIALTGLARPEDRSRVLAAGFAAHVAKPVDTDALVRVVANVLGVAHDPRGRIH